MRSTQYQFLLRVLSVAGVLTLVAVVTHISGAEPTGWFHEARWGVMTHYLGAPPSSKGGANLTAEAWNRQVDGVDVNRFADQINKQSGKVAWRVLTDAGGMFGSAFSSPVYRTLCGKPQLVVQTRMKLAGVEPDSGGVLWSQDIPAMLGMNIVTPTVDGDRIYTSSYGGGSRLLEIKRTGDDFHVATVWKTSLQGYMSTPVIIDGHACLHLRNQKFTCVDLKTGKQTWTTTERYGQYWSLAAQKDRILALDQTGQLLLIHATPAKFDLLDSRKTSEEETWGHLAVCDDQVFIRELKGISAYRWQ